MRFLVANVVYTNHPTRVLSQLRALIQDHQPDVLMLCETKNVDLTRLRGWDVHQGRAWDLARRNAALAWRPPVRAGRARFIWGTDAPGILDRYITRARLSYGRGDRIGVDVMHLAPGRIDSANRTYEKQIERHSRNRHKVWAGDMNEARIPQLAHAYGLRMFRAGVMFFATNLERTNVFTVKAKAFDHAVIVADVNAPGEL